MKHNTLMGLVLVPFGAVSLGGMLCVSGAFGVREVRNDYSFTYRGKSAVVVVKDVRWGPDKTFIRLGNGETIKSGTLISDDGKEITIKGEDGGYSVKDYSSLKDKTTNQ